MLAYQEDLNYQPISDPKVSNGHSITYLVTIRNSGNAATTLTNPLINLDPTGFNLTDVYVSAVLPTDINPDPFIRLISSSSSSAQDGDYSFNTGLGLLKITPKTKIVIPANDGTTDGIYYFKITGTAIYVAP